MYALTISDQRINFLINNGSISNPPVIYLLTAPKLYEKMNEAAQILLTRTMKVDAKRRTITIPKVEYARPSNSKKMICRGPHFDFVAVLRRRCAIFIGVTSAKTRKLRCDIACATWRGSNGR